MKALFFWTPALLALTAALIILCRYHLDRSRAAHCGAEEIFAASRHLFSLAVHLQQHRGMSSAWLAGDASFLPRLGEKQTFIETLFPGLLRFARSEGARQSACFTANEVALFIFRWRNLVQTQAGKEAEQSIAEHSQLIAQLLGWLSALGEERIEPLPGCSQPIGRVRNFSHRLPALTECLGQARAIGASVAARQACSPLARVKLMFLIGRAEAMLEQATQADDAGALTILARAALRELSHAVRTSMLLSDGVCVSPEAFYDVATRAIDGVVVWLEQSGRQLQAQAEDAGSAGAMAIAC
jgi:hypothetical protein